MAEGYAKSRWANERADRTVKILGQVFAFVIALALIGGGFYLAAHGLLVSGFITLAGTLGAIIWAFRSASHHRGDQPVSKP
jgi:hypothetical protein